MTTAAPPAPEPQPGSGAVPPVPGQAPGSVAVPAVPGVAVPAVPGQGQGSVAVPTVPGPPPGPGVVPPFPAPPIEGRGIRVGLGLGIGAAVLVLVCGGGIAAAIGLVSVTGRAANEQAHVVVGRFFDAVKAKRFTEAYNSQCQDVKDRETQAEFTDRLTTSDPITNYKIGDLDLTRVDLYVPVDITYSTGDQQQLNVHLAQDRETAAFQVCGIEG